MIHRLYNWNGFESETFQIDTVDLYYNHCSLCKPRHIVFHVYKAHRSKNCQVMEYFETDRKRPLLSEVAFPYRRDGRSPLWLAFTVLGSFRNLTSAAPSQKAQTKSPTTPNSWHLSSTKVDSSIFHQRFSHQTICKGLGNVRTRVLPAGSATRLWRPPAPRLPTISTISPACKQPLFSFSLSLSPISPTATAAKHRREDTNDDGPFLVVAWRATTGSTGLLPPSGSNAIPRATSTEEERWG